MITLAVDCINNTLDHNRSSKRFYQGLIVGVFVVGLTFGILAYLVSIYISVLEVLVVPTLIWAFKGLKFTDEANVNILDGANRTLSGANNQNEVERKIEQEIESDKQRRQSG